MDHIRVYARIKKVRQEVDANVSVDQNHVIIDDEKAVEISDGPIRRSFIFDKVFQSSEAQSNIHRTASSPLTKEFLSGKNCCIMAFGEKGSGKTFTIFGEKINVGVEKEQEGCVSPLASCCSNALTDEEIQRIVMRNSLKKRPIPNQITYDGNACSSQQDERNSFNTGHIDEQVGISQRMVHEIFALTNSGNDSYSNITITVSFVMIYLEKIVDLIGSKCSYHNRKDDLKFLKLKNKDEKGGVYVNDAVEQKCDTEQDALKCIAQGLEERNYFEKIFDADASKTQSILILKCQKKLEFSRVKTSSMRIIDFSASDISGSIKQHHQRLKKAHVAINNIVDTTLQNSNDWCQIPYRESKLTSLVNDMFTTNCITTLILCVDLTKIKIALPTLELGKCVMNILHVQKDEIFERGKQETVPSRDKILVNDKRRENRVNTKLKIDETQNLNSDIVHSSTSDDSGRGKGCDNTGEFEEISTEINFNLLSQEVENDIVTARKELSQFSDLLKSARKNIEHNIVIAQNELLTENIIISVSATQLKEGKKNLKQVLLKKTNTERIYPINFTKVESRPKNVAFSKKNHPRRLPSIPNNPLLKAKSENKLPKSISSLFQTTERTPVQVYLRLRPLMKFEKNRRSRKCIELNSNGTDFTVDSPLGGEYQFVYNRTFDENTLQCALYQYCCTNVASDLILGLNHSIITLGPVASGKTYTLLGLSLKDEEPTDIRTSLSEKKNYGLGPQIISQLFKKILKSSATIEFTIRCSYVSIYLDNIYDLFEPHENKILHTKYDLHGTQIHSGACEPYCFDEKSVITLLKRGRASLSTIAKRLNTNPHCFTSIFYLKIQQKNLETGRSIFSQLQLIDLTRFESKCKGSSDYEARSIQKSFSAIENVLTSLLEKNERVPYNSPTTSLLQDALGGNSKSTLFITASPSSYNIIDSLGAIRLGQRMSKIHTLPRINNDLSTIDYRKWIAQTETKNKEQMLFIQHLAREIQQPKSGEFSLSNSSRNILASLQLLIDQDKIPCRSETNSSNNSWCSNSKEEEQKSNTDYDEERNVVHSRPSSCQVEYLVRQRQNAFLYLEKEDRETEVTKLSKESQLGKVKIAEHRNSLEQSQYSTDVLQLLLNNLLKFAWKLQRNMIISYESSVDMSSFKPSGSGVSDLFGLSDFDSLLFRTGFSSKDEEKTDSDDTWNGPNSKKKHAAFDENTDEEMHNEPLKKSKKLSSTSISTNVIDNNKFVDECVRLPTDKEVELHKDLKKMTNKCIDLQLLINTEQDHIDTMSDKSDGLAKEMISLRREKVTMTHNSKATSLKIQELQVVNKVLESNLSVTMRYVATLEGGIRILKKMPQTKVVDIKEINLKLGEKLTETEHMVNYLTVPHIDNVEFDLLSKPVPKMNLPLRGWNLSKKIGVYINEEVPFLQRCPLNLSRSKKSPHHRASVSIKRQAKFHRKGYIRKKISPKMRFKQ